MLTGIVYGMKRREYLQQMAIAGTALAPAARAGKSTSDRLGPVLPKRKLGKSGEEVTCLGLGGSHAGWAKDELGTQAVIEKAMEVGIRFYDNAESYGKGRAEELFGKYLIPKYRDEIFLMTKTYSYDAKTAQEHLEGSLKRMKTDRIDLWQIHSLNSVEDVDNRLAAGVLDVALKARDEGKIRHIGFTGHASPYALNRMLENEALREACVACQLVINPVDAASEHSFINETLPKLVEYDIGVLAMKTVAAGRFFAKQKWKGKVSWTTETPIIPDIISLDECFSYVLSLPVTVLISGAESPDLVQEKADLVRNYTSLSEADRAALVKKVAGFADNGDTEFYKNRNLQKPASESAKV